MILNEKGHSQHMRYRRIGQNVTAITNWKKQKLEKYLWIIAISMEYVNIIF